MSLFRSLFVLAALLAAVYSKNTGNLKSTCNDATFGEVTSMTVTLNPVRISPGGSSIETTDGCPIQFGSDYMEVGETVKACLDTDEASPEITEENPPDFSPVLVTCPDGCPEGGVANILQYCGPRY